MFILLFSLLFRWAPINLSCVWSSDILGDKNNFLPAFPVSPGQRPAYCLPWLRFHMIIHVCSRDWSCRNYEATKLRITALSLLLFIIFHYFYSQMAGRPGRVEGCLQVGWGREGGRGWGRFVWRIVMTWTGQTKSQVQILLVYTTQPTPSLHHRNKHHNPPPVWHIPIK